MMQLSSLPSYFEKATATDGDTFDLRFEEAVSMLEQDNFGEAIPIIEEVLNEGCLDIRLIMHLFYAFFLKDGILSFEQAFPLLITLIDNQWDKLSPVKLRESHTSKSIIWFFSTIGKRMKRSIDIHRENRTDSLWERTAILPHETLLTIEEKTKELIEFFTTIWKLPSCQQHLQYTLKWLKEVKEALKPNASSPPQDEARQEVMEIQDTPPAPPIPLTENSYKPPEHLTPSSPRMSHLLEKLALFESLIDERNFKKAAFVGDDIQNILENFDPGSFFPKLFSNYFALIAKYIDTLTMEWENKGSPQWNALENLYRADLEAFVKW